MEKARKTKTEQNNRNKPHMKNMGLAPTLTKARADADANRRERKTTRTTMRKTCRGEKSSGKREMGNFDQFLYLSTKIDQKI